SSNGAQFTGRENDGSELYFYQNRYYHATLQRFIDEDPLGFSAGVNLFEYAFSDPVTYIDPLGLKPQPGFGPGGGKGGGSGRGPSGSPGKGGGPGDGPTSPSDPQKPDPDEPRCKGFGQKVLDDYNLTMDALNSIPGRAARLAFGAGMGAGP